MVTLAIPDDVLAKWVAEFLTGQRATAAPARPARPTAPPAAASPEADTGDPWDSPWPDAPDTGDTPTASTTAPSAGSSGRSSQPSGVVTDDKGRVWTFGAPNAPSCQCGEPAVQVKGKTNGKAWQQWRCAKDYDDYKNKCSFSKFS